MKICLVNPRLRDAVFRAIPHGLLSICACLKNAGHECEIRDYNMDQYRGKGFEGFDAVGFSVFTSQLPHAVELARLVPRSVKVIWGGIHCLLDPLSILQKFPEHWVISGEGELPLLALLEHFSGNGRDPDQTPGLCYVKQGEPRISPPYFLDNLNELADVNYFDLPMLEKYIPVYSYSFGRKLRTLKVITGRGCPWNCTFCINSIFHLHHARHRVKSFDKIRREAEPVVRDFEIEDCSPRDDDFFSNRLLVDQWSQWAGERSLLWSATARFNYIREGQVDVPRLRELSERGLYLLGMAVEAADEELRNRILNKKIMDRDIRRAVEIIRDSRTGIAVNTSFVVYFPGDTEANRIGNIRWMEYLSRNLNVIFSGPQIYRSYPGTRLYGLEPDRLSGKLDYYLQNMAEDGSLFSKRPDDRNRMEFFSETLLSYFNTRFRKLERLPGARAVYPAGGGHFPVLGVVLKILFLPVRIRLRLNFWSCFIEAWLIGAVYRISTSCLRKAIRRVRR